MQLLIAARTRKVAEFIGNVLMHTHPKGYALKYTITVQEVLAILASDYKPDVMIVDLNLPDAECGFELLVTLHNNAKIDFPRIVVLDVTNDEKWGSRLNAECGVTESIHKPLNGGQMLSKIHSAVAAYGQKTKHGSVDQGNNTGSPSHGLNDVPGCNLESVINNEVVAILQSFKAKSDSVYAHSIHVAYTAVGISNIVRSHGNGMGHQILGNEQMFLAGLLHDTGKLNVPNRILFKDGELTQRERETMNLHAVWGADYLSNIKSLREYAVYAYQHHEPSYPRALPIEEISVPTRVIGIADKFSAMIVSRRYRNAIPPASTVEILKPELQQFFGKCAGPIANYLQHTTFTELSKKEQIVSDTVFTHRTEGVYMRLQTEESDYASYGGGDD